MKLIRTISLLAALAVSGNALAAWDIYKSGVAINGGYYDCQLATAAPDFQENFFGRYISGGTLSFDYAEVLTFKNSGGNVCNANVFYRVYRLCDQGAPPAFTSLNLPFYCEFFNNPIPCTPDINNTGDQKWRQTSGVNLLSGLTASGTYVIEVYFNANGHETGGNCGTPTTKFSSNGGVNYRAYFEFETTDSFSDNNVSSGPVWTGDNANFTVAQKSDVAGLLGTENQSSYSLRLNGPLSADVQSLSTAITSWNVQQEWYFFTGRRGAAASASDRTVIWLYATESNLESATVDGYRITIGDDTGDDEIRLERVDNGTGTELFRTTSAIPNGITDWGLTFRVVRGQTGRWNIYTSTLPNITGAGATAWSCVEALSTVQQTNAINGQLYADDTTYTPSGTAYLGVALQHGASASSASGQEFDNLRLLTLPANTSVNFDISSVTVDETSGTYNLVVDINDPSPTVATTVNVVLTAGSATRVNGFGSQMLTFPAGSSSSQTAVITITNNDLCDDVANLTFSLQGVSGGTNAFVGTPSAFAMTITDDNTGYATLVTDDFEDANINGWTTVSSGSWTASNSGPASGSYSMRTVATGVAGQSYVTFDTDDASLPGVETTWRFNVKTFNREPNPAHKFLVFLAANESNLFSTSVDGYAVGVNPVISGDPDLLTLWRVDNGVPTAAIVSTPIDWGITLSEVGFEIIRDENGLWTLSWDNTGDFNSLVTLGSGTETSYSDVGFVGARYLYTASVSGDFAIDDVSITQKGCREIYYSRANGLTTDPIWSTQPAGLPAPATINASRYTRLVIQPGHTVDLTGNLVSDDITIQAGGVYEGNNGSHKVFGNWINDGTFTAGTSTVTMKADEAQSIMGAATTRFHNLVIDNDFGTVSLLTATEVQGTVRPEEGTLQTFGLLTLVSNASGSGGIGPIVAGADVVGNVTLQRYIPSGTAGWVFLACPIPGLTIADWNDDIVTTGFAGSDYPPPYSFNNVQSYDESQPGGRNVGWIPSTNITNTLFHQKGYNVYMASAANTLDVTGQIQKGSVAVSAPFTNTGNLGDGWNLLCNVYPSVVDWVAVEGNSYDAATYYVFDSALPGYRTYNANTLVGSASRYIAHSQSFFVRATMVGQTLNFQESHKSEVNAAFERDEEDSQLIRLRIERNGEADEALIAFIDGATDNFELTYDAEKLESPVVTSPELALVSADGVWMTIDARPELTTGVSIPVYLDLPAAGDYQFIVDEIQNIPAGSCIVIEDVLTGATMIAAVGESLTISTDAAYQGDRLLIHFSAPVSVSATDASCYGSDNGTIAVNALSGDWTVNVFDEMGMNVFSGSDASLIEGLAAGNYTVEVNNAETACGVSSVDVIIAQPIALSTWNETTTDACNSAGNGSILFGVEGAGEYSYALVSSTNVVIAEGSSSEFALEFGDLVGDLYTMSITTSCGTTPVVLDLRDPMAVSASIIASSTSVDVVTGSTTDVTFEANASAATVFNWTLNGAAISAEPSFTHAFDAAGTYTVQLVASNESCSASADVVVTVTEFVSVNEVEEAASVVLVRRDGGIQLTFVNANSRNADVRIFNAAGQLVVSQRANAADGQQLFIDLSGLSQGVYSVQVADGDRVLLTESVTR